MSTQQRTVVSPQVLQGPVFPTVQQTQAMERAATSLLGRLRDIVQNASDMLTPTESLPVLNQYAKNPVTEAAEHVIERRWSSDELRRLREEADVVLAQRYQDEVKRIVQKSRLDVERGMTSEELTDLRQEEQHYEERLKIRVKQKAINIPWPQRADIMREFESRIVARIKQCQRRGAD